MPNGVEFHHLLWGLLQMKLYPTEPVACAIAAGRGEAPDEKTFRKWSRLVDVSGTWDSLRSPGDGGAWRPA